MQPELFEKSDYCVVPLTRTERESHVDDIYRRVKYGVKYMYSRFEVAGILRSSLDEVQTLLDYYKLDSIRIRKVVRIPWWSLCEFLLDPADDVDVAFYKYVSLMPSKPQKSRTIPGERAKFCILEASKTA